MRRIRGKRPPIVRDETSAPTGTQNQPKSLIPTIRVATPPARLQAGSLGFYSGYPSDSERNHIRQRWELDRKAHAIEVEKWYKDRDARRAQESEEVERFQKEEQELVRRREEMNETYRNEEHAWRQKVDNFKEEWQRMVDEETRKRERARLYWDDVKGDEHCLSNGRKRYTARLANLTPSLDAMEACRSTPLALNGVTYEHPVHCESTVRPPTNPHAHLSILTRRTPDREATASAGTGSRTTKASAPHTGNSSKSRTAPPRDQATA
ncbi:hypothetical protein C0993_005234 [Termitomyces sp. T159_Od127]|nr:hypothetical protein C0993_005234 [Termitomyces sp. T159_Od127]